MNDTEIVPNHHSSIFDATLIHAWLIFCIVLHSFLPILLRISSFLLHKVWPEKYVLKFLLIQVDRRIVKELLYLKFFYYHRTYFATMSKSKYDQDLQQAIPQKDWKRVIEICEEYELDVRSNQ